MTHKKLLLDTNILLNFYRMDSEYSLALLEELDNFLKKSTGTKLVLPSQINDEFSRNKSGVIEASIKNIENSAKITKDSLRKLAGAAETSGISATPLNKLIVRVEVEADKVLKKFKERIEDSDGKVAKKLKALLDGAEFYSDDEDILRKAHYRYLRGNPPFTRIASKRKEEWFGDCIIWETLLKYAWTEDLIIVGNDADWRAGDKNSGIHPFLKEEWETHGRKIIFYPSLSSFLKKNGASIPEEISEDEERTISGSFLINRPILFKDVADGIVMNEAWNTSLSLSSTLSNQDAYLCDHCFSYTTWVDGACSRCGKKYGETNN